MKDYLENNKTDLLVSAAKSVVGVVPMAGSLLSELIGNIIPNQRVDRLTKYVKELEERLLTIPKEKINSNLKNEDFIDLIEEGFVQASRAITDERRRYIASIVSNGIKDEAILLHESKQLLKIVSELNDIEVIWLRSYLVSSIGGDKEFREKHKNILQPVNAYLDSDNDTSAKAAIQSSYKEHLERLGLIDHRIPLDSTTKMPKLDSYTGKPRKSHSNITILGRLLLKQIGLIDELNQR